MTKGEQKAKPTIATMRVENVALDLIDQGDQLIRHDQEDESIIELAADIATNGLLQPIGVAPTGTARFQLLYGARRTLACRRLRWETIPAHVHTERLQSIRGIAARENLMRQQLTLAEEIDAVCDLHYKEELSPEQISSLTGKGRPWVLRRLAIPNLPPDLREATLAGDLSIGHSETLARIEDDGMRAYATQQTRSAGLSVNDCRQLVSALLASPNLAEAIAAGEAAAAATPPASEILMRCQSCHEARPLHALAIVRVCADGCTSAQPTAEGDNGHARQ